MNIDEELNALQHRSGPELAAQYEELHGRPPRCRQPAWLRKRVAYRLQERVFGGLSAAARAEIERLASDIKIPPRPAPGDTRPTGPKAKDGGLRPGQVLHREWRGQLIRVEVTADGFVWDGELYASVSAVARAVTGTRWNGRAFFGLQPRGKA